MIILNNLNRRHLQVFSPLYLSRVIHCANSINNPINYHPKGNICSQVHATWKAFESKFLKAYDITPTKGWEKYGDMNVVLTVWVKGRENSMEDFRYFFQPGDWDSIGWTLGYKVGSYISDRVISDSYEYEQYSYVIVLFVMNFVLLLTFMDNRT